MFSQRKKYIKKISDKILSTTKSWFIDQPKDRKEKDLKLWFSGGLTTLIVIGIIGALIYNSLNQASASGETVQFDNTSGNIIESVGTIGIPVNLSSATANTVIVDFSISGDNDDFNLVRSNSIIIPTGKTSAVLPINIVDDEDVEENEIITFEITDVQGASIGTNNTFNLTILDDDYSYDPLESNPEGLPVFDRYSNINSLNVTDGLQLRLDAGSITPAGNVTDPNNSLLLHADGNNGDTTTTDSSSFNHPITFNGDAQISTDQSKFGGSSLKFDGSGDYVSTTHPDFAEVSGNVDTDITLEAWVYPTSTTGNQTIFDTRAAGSQGWELRLNNGTAPFFYFTGSTVISGGSVNLNEWSHIAVTRENRLTKIWVNGVEVASDTFNTNRPSSENLRIGSNSYNNHLNGYLDDIRITKGLARYTTNFTPPTEAHPNTIAGGSTVSTWTDSSGNGNDATQATSANQPTLVTNELNGNNVVRFDGADDWINVNNFTNNTYTSIFTVGKFGVSGNQMFIEHGPDTNTTDGFYFNGSNNAAWAFRRDGAIHYANATTNWMGADYALAGLVYDGSGEHRLNGDVQSNGTISGSARNNSSITDDLFIGARNGSGTFYSEGDIAEILVYDRALSDGERKEVECYLSNKYALEVSGCTDGLVLHLDANSITGNDGDLVNSWSDTSGNGNDATQATSNNQPTLVTNELNGNNVVRFDGVDDWIGGIDSNLIKNTDYTVIAVEGRSSNKNTNYFFGNSGSCTTNTCLHLGYRSDTVLTLAQFANDLDATILGYTSKQFALNSFQHTGTTMKIFREGGLLGSKSSTNLLNNSSDFTVSRVNGNAYYQGDIAEILVYDRALSNSERKQVECYLANKYDLEISGCEGGNSLKLHLDANTISGNDGDLVGSWNDISGNGNDAIQTTTTNQPTLITNELNGKNVVRFDGGG